jgi:hypothetical protein
MMKKNETQIPTLDDVKAGAQEVTKNASKAMDQYIQMGIKVQDEMFKLARQQMDNYRDVAERTLKNQEEFFQQFETNAKNTRDMWAEGLKGYRATLEGFLPKE